MPYYIECAPDGTALGHIETKNALVANTQADSEKNAKKYYVEAAMEGDVFDPATQVRAPNPTYKITAKGALISYTVTARPLADIRADKAREVKAEAQRRILAIAPEWRQRNAIRRGVELSRAAMKAGGEANLSAPQRAEVAALDALSAAIDAVRAASNTIEASLATMTRAQLAVFDAAAPENWLA